MILGMSTSTYTLLHVFISFVAIGSGLAVLFGMMRAHRLDGLTLLFLATTALTSLTGFAFPNEHITPAIVVGFLSLIVLAVAIVARYAMHLRGAWRTIYVITASIALYFNCFVLVAQSFEKVPALHALAPTQKEPPFGIAQLLLLAIFVVLTVMASRRFRLAPAEIATVSANGQRKGAA